MPRARLREKHLREDLAMAGGHWPFRFWQQPCKTAPDPRAGHKIPVDDQDLPIRAQHAPPFCKGCARIDKRPHQMPRDDDIHAGSGEHGALGICLKKADFGATSRRFGAGALQHRFRPIQPPVT